MAGDEKPAIELLDRALKEDTLDHGYVGIRRMGCPLKLADTVLL